MKYGYFRTACASPELIVADCNFNSEKIIDSINKAKEKKVQLIVFPELCVTGYTCGDLFLQKSLLKGAVDGLKKICNALRDSEILAAVGLPVRKDGALYNCAAFIFQGEVLALIPKTNIPNYSEFYERRWFTPFKDSGISFINLDEDLQNIPFGTDILIEDEKNQLIKIACEICEDVWVPLSPSTRHSLKGASIIANLSAGNEVAGKSEYRRSLVKMQSAKNVCAYIYASAGQSESTTDMIFSGHNLIALNGTIKNESRLFHQSSELLIADLDLEKLEQDRVRTVTFAECAQNNLSEKENNYLSLFVDFQENENDFSENDFYDFITPHPFVPSGELEQKERLLSVIEMQSEGLAKRLRHIHAKSAVIGLSGGLDSTLALLVTARAFDKCSLDRKNIFAITMPCFGTTDRTYRNACLLAEKTNSTLKEIDLKKSVMQHFEDIGQNPEVHDVTYENGQARSRTLILMDYANKTGGIVIGTGDLSELALGWCTYNGDHMSMYGVNSSIPKTLVRYLVSYFAEEERSKGNNELCEVLQDILATPVSPELIPPDSDGKISQKTEEIVGPYELHDFFLYYVLRWGFSPEKIFFLAQKAFAEKKDSNGNSAYTNEVLLKWLKNFYRRFFSQQFKRNCMPDGAKVGTVNLSPRGDWRMPSDASCQMWMKEIQDLEKILGKEN